jgi:hypothetical protein
VSPSPEQMARGARTCAVLDDALDEILVDAREALALHGPVSARGEVALALVMAAAIGKAENVVGLAATAILRLAQLEQIDTATEATP